MFGGAHVSTGIVFGGELGEGRPDDFMAEAELAEFFGKLCKMWTTRGKPGEKVNATLKSYNDELMNDNATLKDQIGSLKDDNASLRGKVDVMTSELLSLTKNLSAAHDPFDHAQEASMEYVEGLSLVASLTLKLPAVTLLTTLRPFPCHRTPITVVQGSAA